MGKILLVWRMFRDDLLVMLVALRHRGTPRAVKAAFVIGLIYFFSPIDLIPDTIPFFGMLDDAAVLPAAVFGLSRLLPSYVRRECEADAERLARRLPLILLGLSIFLIVWAVFLVWGIIAMLR